MQEIIIQLVEPRQSKDGTKTFYIIHTQDGAQMASFDEAVTGLAPGTTIDAEIEVKGKYTNLKTFKVKSPPAVAPPPPAPPQPYRPDPQTQLRVAEYNKKSIEKQVAVKEVGEALRHGIEIPSTLVAAYWVALGDMIGCTVTWESLKSASDTPQPANAPPLEGEGPENAKEGPRRAYPKPTADDLGALRYYAGKIAAQYKETADVRLARICKAQMVEKIEDLTADQVAQIVASLKEALKPGKGAK